MTILGSVIALSATKNANSPTCRNLVNRSCPSYLCSATCIRSRVRQSPHFCTHPFAMPIATTKPHPHLPVPLGVLSEWQRTVRDHPLLNSGKDDALPESADVVIVGSGMCGMSAATSWPNTDWIRCCDRKFAPQIRRETRQNRRSRSSGNLFRC